MHRCGVARTLTPILILVAAAAGIGALVTLISLGLRIQNKVQADTSISSEDLLADWETPAVAFVLTGEMHGYIEPCGCSENMPGGLSRRFDCIQRLADRGWPVVPLDAGGMLHPERVDRRQSEIKLQHSWTALHTLGYRAIAVGLEEARMGADGFFNAYDSNPSVSNSEDVRTQTPYLAANLRLYDASFDVFPLTHMIIEEGGVKIAVTSVISPELVLPHLLGSQADLMFFEEPAAALERILPELKAAEPDVLVLLSHCTAQESEELARQFPDFHLVVTAGGPEDGEAEPKLFGNTLVLRVGMKGKRVGVVGFYPDAATPLERFRYELVELGKDRFEQTEEMVQMMAAYQAQLIDERPDRTEPPHPGDDDGRTYIGAEACGECHSQAYEIWTNTKHSHAFAVLAAGRPGEEDTWVDRSFDAECITCHVAGWKPQQALRYESGYVDGESTPQFLNVQCENCHGPGSRHRDLQNGEGTEEDRVSELDFVRLPLAEARNKCLECHDVENSIRFHQPEAYPFEEFWWKEIEHYGID